MKLYTSTMSEQQSPEAISRGIGCLIASSPHKGPGPHLRKLPHCALDNGAFVCWQKGYPFQAETFLTTLAACYRAGIELDWIVIPDIVAGGRRSLEFSASWIRRGGRSTQRHASRSLSRTGWSRCTSTRAASSSGSVVSSSEEAWSGSGGPLRCGPRSPTATGRSATSGDAGLWII